jgi:hypothetical protein
MMSVRRPFGVILIGVVLSAAGVAAFYIGESESVNSDVLAEAGTVVGWIGFAAVLAGLILLAWSALSRRMA